jgi:uncharacterized protein YneF (UPF0154 family)
MKVILGIVLVVVMFVGFVLAGMYFSNSNKEIDLRTQITAQNGKIEAVFDQMVKIISGKSQVTSEYKNSFKDIYIGIMEGRYSKGDGALLKLVQEQNPTFDALLFKELSQSIEVERNNFTREQETMIDLVRVHTNLLTKFPSSLFLGSRSPITYVVISSSATKETMKTRTEENAKIF